MFLCQLMLKPSLEYSPLTKKSKAYVKMEYWNKPTGENLSLSTQKDWKGNCFWWKCIWRILNRLIHHILVESNIILFTVPWFNVRAGSVIHRTGAPRLWWGHSHRVNQPLPHTVPVSQTSHDHSSAPSTKPKPWSKICFCHRWSWSEVRVYRANLNHHKSCG